MSNITSFDILSDYPKINGFDFETHKDSKRFYLFPQDPLLKTKYLIFKTDNITFVAYDSYSTNPFMNRTFCGVYSHYECEDDFECRIFKKTWADSFLRSNRRRTGNKWIDNKITIISKSRYSFEKLFDQSIIEDFYRLCDGISPIEILIQNDYLQIVKDLNNKRILGIETNQWIYEYTDVENLISIGGLIIQKLKKSAANSQ